jgi:hypothetical protein
MAGEPVKSARLPAELTIRASTGPVPGEGAGNG